MSLSSAQIKSLVDRVIERLDNDGSPEMDSSNLLGVFATLEEAFLAAKSSQKELKTLELRNKAVQAMRSAAIENAKLLAERAVT